MEMDSRPTAVFKAFFKVILFSYMGICLCMCGLQRSIMYHPSNELGTPDSYGLKDFSVLSLQDEDGTHIQAWYHPARASNPTLVFFHGNGGNNADHSRFFNALTQTGFGLLAVEYRGYGTNEGSPSETGFYEDGRAAINYANHTLGLPASRLIPYGESIGTGVAVEMAAEFPVAALVLQSPYTSTESVAAKRYPWLPVHWLMSDRFDSIGKIGRVHAPLLLMHGEQDNIIPIEESKALFAQANPPKDAIYFPDRGHNDLDISPRLQALGGFIQKYHLNIIQ